MDEQEVIAAVAERVRTHRRLAGMTQLQLAERIGCSRASIANMETARQDTPVTTLLAIASALGINASALLPAQGATDAEIAWRIEAVVEENRSLAARIETARAALAGDTEEG